MVGPPKRLEDLRKVEGAVRVTCRSCATVSLLELEQLIRARFADRQTTDWRAVQHGLPCPNCSSSDVRVEGVPFGDRNPELRARRAEVRRLALALQVLKEAAPRTSTMPTAAVQLALRVLHPYLGDRELLMTYWSQISAENRQHPWGSAHQALRWITVRLVDRGWPVPDEFR